MQLQRSPSFLILGLFVSFFCGIEHTLLHKTTEKVWIKKLGQEGKIWVSDIRIYFSVNPKMTWHSKRFKLLLFSLKGLRVQGALLIMH